MWTYFSFLLSGLTLNIVAIETELKGNLIFEYHPYPTIVNPKLANFFRHVDLTYLHNAVNVLEDFEAQYRQFCTNSIKKTRKSPRFFKHYMPSTFEHAQSECFRQGGQLAEIRDHIDADFLLQGLHEHNISNTFAGLVWDSVNHTLRYQSDYMPNVFAQFVACSTNCTPITTISEMTQHIEKITTGRFENLEFQYIWKYGSIYITPYLYNNRIGSPINSIRYLCKVIEPSTNRLLTTLAKHSCMRDRDLIKAVNQHLREEVNQFFVPNDLKNSTLRFKRDYKEINTMIAGAESTISIARGKAPMDWVGKLLGGLIGTATADDVRLTRDVLINHAQVLHNITFNQLEIVRGYAAVIGKIHQLERYNQLQEHDTAVLFAELDNKVTIKSLQNLIQITLLKIASAIEAATHHNTSPYIFGQTDLDNVTTRFRLENTPLTTELQRIITSVVVVDGIYTFIISIPESNEKNEFHFYRIHDLPLFQHGKGFKLDYNHKFIGVNGATNEYLTVTEKEYDECTSRPVCTLRTPFRRIIPKSAPCEILTFKYSTQHCKLQPIDSLESGFVSFENETYYSVPEPTNIQVSCSKNNRKFTEPEVLAGIGKFILPPGCQIQIGENINIRPGFIFSKQNLESNKIFSILTKIPDALIVFPDMPNYTLTTWRPLKLKEVTNIKDALDIIFNDETAAMMVIRIIAMFVLVLIGLGIIYCFIPQFREWFNACCFFVKPSKFWTRIKGYEGFPELISKRKRLQQKEIEHTYVPINSPSVDEQLSIITEPCKPPHNPDKEMEPDTFDKQTFPHLHALFYPNFRKQYDLPH
jgi:hypothetical protein